MTVRHLVIAVALVLVGCKSEVAERAVARAEPIVEATELAVAQTTITTATRPAAATREFKRVVATAAPRAKAPKPPVVRVAETRVCCRLPAEMITRIVRSHFSQMRACYEAGLKRDPAIAGKVMIGFTIQRDGSVAGAKDAGGDLDAATRACVVSAFAGLTFPEPEGGPVSVTYPITFNPA